MTRPLIASLAVAVAACAPGAKTAASLRPGDRVALSVAPTAEGQTAAMILAEGAAEEAGGPDDQGGVDCQNGLDPAGKPCDGGPAANPNDGSTADAADPSGEAVVPETMLHSTGSGFTANGLDILAAGAIPQGVAVRFIGRLDASNRFVATSERASTARTERLVGRIQSVAADKNGLTLRVLGQAVHVSGDEPVEVVDSLEKASAADADGINCDQTGQNQGDNTGCPPPVK